jgi:hypothetical protein
MLPFPRGRVVKFYRRIDRPASILIGALWAGLLGTFSSAVASTNVFQFYSQICISVYELHEDHKYKIRDDLSREVSSELEREIRKINKWISVAPHSRCIKPSDKRFDKVMQFELFAKQQALNLDNDVVTVVIVGGSSSNARGPFSDYELQPIVLLNRSPIDDVRIKDALTQYVKRVILPVLKGRN